MPVHRGGEVSQEVMRRPGRFRKVAENLEVKEVVGGTGRRDECMAEVACGTSAGISVGSSWHDCRAPTGPSGRWRSRLRKPSTDW